MSRPEPAPLAIVPHPEHTSNKPQSRIVAVDVLRGLVMLLLLPDLSCAFSVCRMHKLYPDDRMWQALSDVFTHVPWVGSSVWDMVMPIFVFVVGLSMAFSFDARRRTGMPWSDMVLHAVIRCLTLGTLGIMLMYGVHTRVDELLPFMLLATGLPLYRWLCQLFGRPVPANLSHPDAVVSMTAVLLAWVWMLSHPIPFVDLELLQILLLIGLAYMPAFLTQSYGWRVQTVVAVLVLIVFAAIFIAYPAPKVDSGGFVSRAFAHWDNGTNAAAAFDRWLLNMFPRSTSYEYNAHGYHTLQFVPLITTILAGALVGGQLISSRSPRVFTRWLFVGGCIGLGVSCVLASTLFPLVKSLWTPSWSIFSISVSVLVLAALLLLFADDRRAWLAQPIAILGSNAVLLYVIAYNENWRLVKLWTLVLPHQVSSLTWWPVLQWFLVLLALWMIAYILHRGRIYVRL